MSKRRNFFDIDESSEHSSRSLDSDRAARRPSDVERSASSARFFDDGESMPAPSARLFDDDDDVERSSTKRRRVNDDASARRRRKRSQTNEEARSSGKRRRREREDNDGRALVVATSASANERPRRRHVRASHIPSLDNDDDDDDDNYENGIEGEGASGRRKRRAVDYRRPFVELLRMREQAESAYIDQVRPRGSLDFLYDATDGYRVDTRALGGWQRLARLQFALTSFDEAIAREQGTSGRSPDQKWFHRKMIIAVLPLLFGDDLDANLETLQRQFGFVDIHKEVLVITPRRHGKTWSVAMFAAAYAHAMGSSEQAIFSTGRRASEKLLDLVFQFVSKIPGFTKSDVERNNQETLWLRGPSTGDIRKVFSYPSKIEIRSWRVRTRVCVARARV